MLDLLGIGRRRAVTPEVQDTVTAKTTTPAAAAPQDLLAATKTGASVDVTAITVSATGLKADPVAALMKMFEDIAATVPYVVPKMVPSRRGGGMEIAFRDRSNEPPQAPYEDRRFRYDIVADRTIPYAEALKSRINEREDGDAPQLDIKVGREGGSGSKAFFLLASTSRAQLWTAAVGKGLAHFAMERYGRYANHPLEGRPKLTHAAQVAWHTSMIADNHEKRGIKLDGAWRDRLEYAAFLHDVGYYNGGFAHPGKGGLDMLINLKSYLKSVGTDVSQDEVEKIALMAECHGMSFPWDQGVDPQPRVAGLSTPEARADRFSGYHYISADVVWGIVQPSWRKFVQILRQESAAYLAANPNGMKWLDDEQQVKNLVLGGWMLHCGDKFLGEDMLPSPTRQSRAGRGVYAQNVPIQSEAELNKFHRDGSLDAMLQAVFAPDVAMWLTKQEKPIYGSARSFDAGTRASLTDLAVAVGNLVADVRVLRGQVSADSATSLSHKVDAAKERHMAAVLRTARAVDAGLLGELCHVGPGTPSPVSPARFVATIEQNMDAIAAFVAAHPDIRV